MSKYSIKISWKNTSEAFTKNKYSRAHTWHFDGGLTVPASSSPAVVPLPYSDEQAVDPEEAFIAALSSCHMLWFLSLAAGKGFVVQKYADQAEGILEKHGAGEMAFSRITLKPVVRFGGDKIPSEKMYEELHQLAHEKCFLANSVKTEIVISLK